MNKYLDLILESEMAPTPTPYSPNSDISDVPTVMFVLFDENKKPILSKRGVIISTFATQGLIDNYANSLYDLVKNASEVYSIIPELYTQAVTKLDDKEYYKYIKDNSILHSKIKDLSKEEAVYIDSLDDDTDFNIE